MNELHNIMDDNNYLVSPADGRISSISEVKGPIELGLDNKQFIKVSIFMNVFDCHVNRSPINGEIEEIFYKPGKFLNASLDKASEENERNYFNIKNKDTNEKSNHYRFNTDVLLQGEKEKS